jgi:high affinity Mn2+ porin
MMRMRATAALWALVVGIMLGGFAGIGAAYAADKAGDKKGSAIADSFLPLVSSGKAGTWTGFYVGGHLGYGIGVNDLSLRPKYGDGSAFLDGLAADGAIYGLHAGFDYQLPNSIFVLGVRAGYTWSDMAFKAGISPGPVLTVKMKDGWFVDGVLGLAVGNVKPYVFAGWTEVATGGSVADAGFSGPDLQGWRAGTGVEWKLPGAPFVSLALDYAYTRYDGLDYDLGCYTLGIDPEDHRVTVKLNFRVPPK